MPLHPLQAPQQPKGHLNPHVTPSSLPQSSQLPNLPILPLHSSTQPPPLHQPQMPTAPSQLQQSLPTTGIPHMPLQPPLPPQLRPPSIGTFQHQYPPQMATNVGYQHAGAPQHHSQPSYHVSRYHYLLNWFWLYIIMYNWTNFLLLKQLFSQVLGLLTSGLHFHMHSFHSQISHLHNRYIRCVYLLPLNWMKQLFVKIVLVGLDS